jgi:hypothetical protein
MSFPLPPRRSRRCARTDRPWPAVSAAILLVAGAAAAGCSGRRPPPPAVDAGPPGPLRCGDLTASIEAGGPTGLRLALSRAPQGELALGLTEKRVPLPVTLDSLQSDGSALIARVQAGEGLAGAVRLSCGEGEGELVVAWQGAESIRLLLVARPEAGAVFVPGGPLLGGEGEAPWGLVTGNHSGLLLPAGRFLWSPSPARLEASWTGPLRLVAGDPRALAGRALGPGAAPQRWRGRVEGVTAADQRLVIGLDSAGKPAAVAPLAPDGSFELASGAPLSLAFLALGGSRLGPAVKVEDPLVLASPAMGVLRVEVLDHDRGVPLPSRIVVHGHEGPKEPNFGPPFRASAGPLIDSEDGQARMLLPAGRYRVLATRGMEYSVDQRVIEVPAGGEARAELRLRRVVATPGWVGCDLHVHSRGSFDSVVSIDDRVRSLMAAGLDFAIPSEHNRVGSYDASLVAGQGAWLAWVPAVEVTTVNPLRGHFNVFPYTLAAAPSYTHTGLGDLVRFIRRETPGSIIQVNHPNMGRIGHFNAVHVDPETQRGVARLAQGFDTIEVYNGFDLGERAKTEQTVLDWMRILERGRFHWATGNSDSHAVQYISVGYPRTYVNVGPGLDHDGGEGPPVDVPRLVEALRQGRAIATSGPLVEVSQGDQGPGGRLQVSDGKARVRVKVRAAPWVDAHDIEVYVGARSVLTKALATRPARVGPPEGTLDEERQAAVLFDDELEVPVAAGSRALVVVVRGARSVGEVLPFMDFWPMAISNPLLIPLAE